MSGKPIRILIADDHPVFRFGLRALIASVPEMEVVGEAARGDEALSLAAELRPDVILMDIGMPEINGIEATRRILAENPEIGILVITMSEDDTVFEAIRAGARGYILKGADPEETLRAMRAVASGEAIFSPKMAERLIAYFGRQKQLKTFEAFPELTAREREVLHLMAQGLTNAAIAQRLVISPKTVRNHITTIFSKLQVANRVEAIMRARQAGMGGV